jgi:hypothetical protein
MSSASPQRQDSKILSRFQDATFASPVDWLVEPPLRVRAKRMHSAGSDGGSATCRRDRFTCPFSGIRCVIRSNSCRLDANSNDEPGIDGIVAESHRDPAFETTAQTASLFLAPETGKHVTRADGEPATGSIPGSNGTHCPRGVLSSETSSHLVKRIWFHEKRSGKPDYFYRIASFESVGCNLRCTHYSNPVKSARLLRVRLRGSNLQRPRLSTSLFGIE